VIREINRMSDALLKDFYDWRYRHDASPPNDHQVARLAVVDAYVSWRADLLSPDFSVRYSTTVYARHRDDGLYRLINSVKLRALADALWLGSLWSAIWERAGFGLYLVVLAARRSPR